MTATVLLGMLRVRALDVEVRTMRRWLYDLLTEEDASVVEDVVLAASEVVTNAIEHSDSGVLGGEISIAALAIDGSTIRMEVVDDGSSSAYPTVRKLDVDAVGGRGLQIVRAVSAGRWGACSEGSGQMMVWFEVPLS
jgi:anti-sigma regulatory factor (Ser/Thr protein kinase)